MSEILCPDCGHEVEIHSRLGFCHVYGCPCRHFFQTDTMRELFEAKRKEEQEFISTLKTPVKTEQGMPNIASEIGRIIEKLSNENERVRAERDQYKAERDALNYERLELNAIRDALAGKIESLEVERDALRAWADDVAGILIDIPADSWLRDKVMKLYRVWANNDQARAALKKVTK